MARYRANRSGGLLWLTWLVYLSIGSMGWADLLIEEPFDYPAAQNRGDDSLAGADGGTGWLVAWDTFIEGETEGYIEVVPGSLPFSSYPTSGNHVAMGLLSTTQPADNGTTFARPTRSVDVTVESGDLWASYLYQRIDDANGNGSRWAEIRDNEGFQFALDPKAPDSHGIRTRYDNTFGDNAEDVSVQDHNVYLMVARFSQLGTVDGGGSGAMWALSEANYDAIKANGITEAELNANHVLKAVDEDPGITARTLQSGDRLRFLIGTEVARSENFPFEIAFDELRYGTVLADVVPGLRLLAGDSDQDLDFDQLDLVRVQQAAKYLTGQPATWGEGDWDGAPGGSPGNPPAGNGLFDQLDIISALGTGTYLTGPYAAIRNGGSKWGDQSPILYGANQVRTPIPEPSAVALAILGLLGFAAASRGR